MSSPISSLTGKGNYFEDFAVGAKMRHARGTTIGEIENQMLTKLVLNTADGHYNEHRMRSTNFGQRLVFGLVTGSVCIGLATQDTAENALAELALTGIRFTSPVSQAIRCMRTARCSKSAIPIAPTPASCASSIGEPSRTARWCSRGERTVLIKRRSHWVDR